MIEKNVVHVWQYALQNEVPQLEQFKKLLSIDEIDRANRFVYEKDRRRFIVARARLRELLAYYTQIPAQSLVFAYNEHGKPSLQNNNLQFNLSHSDELAVYAFSSCYSLGIDIEVMKDNVEAIDIAERFFSTNEAFLLKQLPHEQQLEAFFYCWTRKEALIKAFGQGLFFELNQCEVTIDKGEARVVSIHNNTELAKDWTMHTFSVAEHYIGAIAVNGMINNFIFKNKL